jgi:photosystem II stability/assembly factor-like uncharacterized protein
VGIARIEYGEFCWSAGQKNFRAAYTAGHDETAGLDGGDSAGTSLGWAQGAAVWQMEQSGTTAGLRGIDSVDGQIAWASGTEGTVLRTVDGGQHWQRCATPDGDKDGAMLDFRGVQAWDAKTAIVMASGPGEKSRLYKTTDGCGTWKLLFTNPDNDGFFDSFRMFIEQRTPGQDEGFGLILGDPVRGELAVFETRSGGKNWERLHNEVLRTEGSAFAASNRCIASINATNEFVFGGNAPASKVRLNYSGYYWLNDNSPLERTWSKVTLPILSGSSSKGPFSIASHVRITYAADGFTAVNLRLYEAVVGGDYLKPNEPTGTAAYSLDGGLHWAASASPPHGYRSSVQWSEQEKLWITVGTNGSDVSRDDGKTWQPIDDGNWNALSLPFVVGPKGRIARLNTGALPKR